MNDGLKSRPATFRYPIEGLQIPGIDDHTVHVVAQYVRAHLPENGFDIPLIVDELQRAEDHYAGYVPHSIAQPAIFLNGSALKQAHEEFVARVKRNTEETVRFARNKRLVYTQGRDFNGTSGRRQTRDWGE